MTEAGWTRQVKLFVPRILRDDGMIDSQEVEHYTHLNLAKYVLAADYDKAYQQGRVAGLAKAVEIIKANTDVKKAIEIIRLHSLAQQAQEAKGE